MGILRRPGRIDLPVAVGIEKQQTPTLYDDVAVAYAIDPALCPVSPMKIEVDGKGLLPGLRTAEQLCLSQLRFRQVFQILHASVVQQKLAGSLAGSCAKSP
jgi:purine nucleosidase